MAGLDTELLEAYRPEEGVKLEPLDPRKTSSLMLSNPTVGAESLSPADLASDRASTPSGQAEAR